MCVSYSVSVRFFLLRMFRVTWCPPDRLPGKVAKICTKDGHKQTNKTSTKIQTKRTKKHRTTEEEMEGPTSSGGSRNRLTCLTLQERDDDDDDDLIVFQRFSFIALQLKI